MHSNRAFIIALAMAVPALGYADKPVECVKVAKSELAVQDKSCEDFLCGFLLLAPRFLDENPLLDISLTIGTEEKPLVMAPLKYSQSENQFVETGFFVSQKHLSILRVTAHYGIKNGCQLMMVYNGS